jgi:hypothetical protein
LYSLKSGRFDRKKEHAGVRFETFSTNGETFLERNGDLETALRI